ncbi:MAG: PEGA domain-containing protein [Deltaproteobacteria bacterium]|nr:PEGA domain-containing protein [Deltaproteobacteria bacterium]
MFPKVVPVYLILCLSLLAGHALTDDRIQALEHFKAGISFLKADDAQSAAEEFEKSMSLYPNKGALFNLANSYKALNRYAEALEAFRRLRTDFGDKLKKDMRDATERNEREIRDLVSELEIQVDRDNADVHLDDRKVGESPLLEPLVLNPGVHKVVVSLEGYRSIARTVEAVAGGKQSEIFELVQEQASPVVPAPIIPEANLVEDKEGKPRLLKPIFWTGVSATLAAGIVAGVFWGLAGSRHDEYEEYNDKVTTTTSAEMASMSDLEKESVTDKRNDAGEDVEKYGHIALGFSIGAGALAVASAIVLVMDLSEKNSKKKASVSIKPGRVVVSF